VKVMVIPAMRDLGSKWRGVLMVCPELEALKQRIGAWLVRHGEMRGD
jgi:hypothetical protein